MNRLRRPHIKKTVTFFIVVFFFLSCFISLYKIGSVRAVTSLSPLTVNGVEIEDSSGNSIALRGVNNMWLTGDSDGAFMDVTTWNEDNVASEFALMRDWGANVVRFTIAVDLYKFNMNNGGQYNRYVIDRVLSIAEEAGLYVILSPAHLKSDASYSPVVSGYQNPLPYPPYQGDDYDPNIPRPRTDFSTIIASKAEFVSFWSLLASTTMNHTNVMYEIWNEPQGTTAILEDYYSTAQDCLDAIRDAGATQIVLINGENWGSPSIDLKYPPGNGLDWFTDSPTSFTDATGNLAISAHNYRGHIYDTTTTPTTNCYTSTNLNTGLNYLDYYNQTYPVIMTEIGMIYNGGTYAEQYFENMLTLLDAHGISYCAWVFTSDTSYRLHTGFPTATPNAGGLILQSHLSYNITDATTSDSFLLNDGFESGDFTAWTGIAHSGTATDPVVSGTSPLNGTYSCLATTTGGGSSYSYKNFTAVSNATLDFWVKIVSGMPDAGNILYLGNLYGTSEYISAIITNTDGSYYWGVRYSTTSTSESTASNPAADTLYHLLLTRNNEDNSTTLTVNGVVKVSTTYAMTQDNARADVGVVYSSQASSAKVDDVKVYTTVEGEITPLPTPTATPTPSAPLSASSYITITPSSATIVAGQLKIYSVNSYNQYGSFIGDVTSSTTFSISSGAGGSWDGSIYTSQTGGYWTVTAFYSGLYAYANLVVTPAVSNNATLQLTFDNEIGDACYDWSGHDNSGVISGASRSYDGQYGMGLSFDGNDYVTVVDDDTLDFEDTMIISLWVKPTSFTDCVLIDKPDAYGLTLNANGTVSFRVNSEYYTPTDYLALNSWQHIICQLDSNIPAVSVNEHSTFWGETDNITATAHDVVIGDQFIGLMDEIYLYESYPSNPFYQSIAAVAYYPYCYSFNVGSSSTWLTQGVSYNFSGVYIRENSTAYLTDVSFSFADTESTMGLSWYSSDGTASSGVFTQTSGSGKIVFKIQSATVSNNALLLSSSIEIETTIQSTLSVSVTMNCTDYFDRSNTRIISNIFNIYGIGGVTTSILIGDGSQVAGGSIFDVMAQNSSLTGGGSSAQVSTIVNNFQHFHTLVSLYQGALWVDDADVWDSPTYCHETGYLEYGVTYIDPSTNDTVDGWYVKIEVINGAAGDYNESQNADAWVELNCTWYNNDEFVKSDQIYCAYDAYHENDTTTQFEIFVDLWLSSQSSSSMVGGSVSAQYYGLTENGWWLWQNWGPVSGLQTQSVFYDYLYDSNGNVTTASALDVFGVWTKIAKTSQGDGPNSDDYHVWATTCKNLQFFTLPIGQTLTGINTPVFNPTTTPDMPVGFFAELGNLLANALESLRYYMSTFAATAAGVTSSALNSAFEAVGVSEAVTGITGFASSIGAYFSDSVSYISNLLYTIFTLFTSIANFLIEWFGNFISMLISIGNTVVTILNGTNSITGALGEVWSFFPTDAYFWTAFVPLILVIYWFDSIDKRAKQYGGGWMSFFMSDVQNIISVFSFIIDLAWRVVSTVIDLSMRFFNILV